MDTRKLTTIAEFLVLAALGVNLVYWIWRFFQIEYRRWQNNRAPVCETVATSISRRMTCENADLDTRDGGWVYYITFQTDAGLVLELSTGRRNYALAREGSRGTITWQGSRLELFEPLKEE